MPSSDWRMAKSLEVLRKQLNADCPGRSTVSDGGVGDTAHASRDSDHNPWIKDGDRGVVTARDFTHDPANGADMNAFVARLVASRDPRIKYLIWDRKMWRSYDRPQSGSRPFLPAWTPEKYTGSNAHTKHAHVSVCVDKKLYDDTRAWFADQPGEPEEADVYPILKITGDTRLWLVTPNGVRCIPDPAMVKSLREKGLAAKTETPVSKEEFALLSGVTP